jgi:hypothetical protein
MVEYLYQTENYAELLLTDNNNISTDFIPTYISGITHSGFTRYLASENRKYTIEESYLYKILEYIETNINDVTLNGKLEEVV